jgi:hypothetical protein
MVLQTAMSSTELMLAWCIASAAPYGLDAAFLNVWNKGWICCGYCLGSLYEDLDIPRKFVAKTIWRINLQLSKYKPKIKINTNTISSFMVFIFLKANKTDYIQHTIGELCSIVAPFGLVASRKRRINIHIVHNKMTKTTAMFKNTSLSFNICWS